MAKMQFEVNLNGAFKVWESAVAILTESPDTPGDAFPAPGPFDPTESNMVAQTDQELHIRLKWRVTGTLPLIMAGKWDCAVYLEQMGSGEYPGGPFTKTVNLVAVTDHTYDVKIDVPAGAIPVGVYKIVVAVTLRGPAPSNAALPVAAFAEVSPLFMYDAA